MTPGRVFLDTNVFIIGVALPDSPEAQILRWAGFGMPQHGTVEVVVSQELFEQILHVGRRLKGKDWGSEIVGRIWKDMTFVYVIVPPHESRPIQQAGRIPREDIGIYLTAHLGQAQCFISSNHELIRSLAGESGEFECLSPQDFVDRYLR
jgi:predicted nucleic acid-binding protein